MKILLTTPVSKISNVYGRFSQVAGNIMPIGLAYIASALKREMHRVKILDPILENLSSEEFYKRLKEYNPEIVGISFFTVIAQNAFKTAEISKSAIKSVKVLAGGPHVSLIPIETFKECQFIDYVIPGEGESIAINLCNALQDKTEIDKIKGIYYRKNGNIIKTPKISLINNLDLLPYPAFELLQMEKYQPSPNSYKNLPTYPVIGSRGCPYNCSFCTSIMGKKHRKRSPENIGGELKILKGKYRARGIIFYDEMFTMDKSWVKEICSEMCKNKMNLLWRCFSRIDNIDKELLVEMKKAGCWQISFGIESGNQQILDSINKGIDIDKIVYGIKTTKSLGIEVHTTFIIGLPGENKETLKDTSRLLKYIKPDIAGFCTAVPYPKSKLFELAKKSGMLHYSGNWTQYRQTNLQDPIFVPNGFTKKSLLESYKKLWRNFFLTPSYIIRYSMNVKTFTDIKRGFKSFKTILLLK